MDERSSRVLVGLAMLVALWIGVYWLWRPGADRRADISFDPTPARAEQQAESESKLAEVESDSAPAPAPEVMTIEPPAYREYIVGRDETFESIAAREYGGEAYWSAIARANPLKDPGRLEAGDVLRLPIDPGKIQGGSETTPTDPDSEVPVYIVQSGDTLSGIAKREYGSAIHWEWLFAQNRDVLESPESLNLGDVLKIVPLPETP